MLSRFFRKKKQIDDVRVDKSMRDYSKEAFFIKKAETAKEELSKWGLPKELTAAR